MKLILISTILVILVKQSLCQYFVLARIIRSIPQGDYHGYNGDGGGSGGKGYNHLPLLYYNSYAQHPIQVTEQPAPVNEQASEPESVKQIPVQPIAPPEEVGVEGKTELATAAAPALPPKVLPSSLSLRTFVPITLTPYAQQAARAQLHTSIPQDSKASAPAAYSARDPVGTPAPQQNPPAPTITRHIVLTVRQPYPVPVPQPYPVHYPKLVPVSVPKPYPVPVDRPVPVSYSHHPFSSPPLFTAHKTYFTSPPILLSSLLHSKPPFHHEHRFKHG